MLASLCTVVFRPASALVLAALVALPARADPASAPDGQAPAMRAWLVRIHQAASQRNFQGTFIVTGGGVVSSARIAHYCEGPNQYERSEALDGQARQVYRHNDVVATLWPATRVAVIEQRHPLSEFPSLLQAGDDAVADHYEVTAQGSERVAGREANVLSVTPRDELRYGYRLWSDRASGLLLRADVIGDRHQVLESSAFSDVAIGVKAQPDTVLLPMKKLDGYRVLRPEMTPTRLEAEGWTLREPVAGFREVSGMKRPIETPLDGRGVAPGRLVLQAVYSDGLTYVSVFIEPFDPQRHLRPMTASVGPTQSLMMRQGDWWVTVVGDVPAATVRRFAKGLERTQK